MCSPSFRDVRILFRSEKECLLKLAPRLTLKACLPSSLERQYMKLVLQAIHESTISALLFKMSNVVWLINLTLQIFSKSSLLYANVQCKCPYKRVSLNDSPAQPFGLTTIASPS
ncbi:hypothetical protein LOD99_11068 [Oopsacas minuta]|uniref:Uncharacterized protein n=1 Tax=Oopsacas minuta TaxID=111878 RepID=A0AAV7KB23_9METZ|nr:hypothetical protein LOD99_11068 [Oopsacas minuta]